jgi:hypothetical protein
MSGFSPLTVAQKLLRRIPFIRLDVNCLHCLEYYPCEVGSEAADEAIVVRDASEGDVEGMAECGNFPESLPERFAAHEHSVVGISGRKVIGYQWFCDKPFRIEERYGYVVEIPSDAVYGYDAFVLPNYRRAGVWRRFHVQYLKSLLGKLRRSRVIVMVDQNNSVSMLAHLRVGYRLYRKIYIFFAFGKCLCVKKDVSGGKEKFTQGLPPMSSTANPRQVTSLVS